jgi:UDP-N-acetylglucosamine 2-epimerase (non-hydrolysing)/GDP/UDP-N,N'-diacetylbacillosamine 2-epimerase (hydrolysing)
MSPLRHIGVVTVARSDYGIYYPVLRALERDPDCELCLIVGGSHLSSTFGNTVSEIEHDGFEIKARVHMLLASDSPEAVAMSIGLGLINFAEAYRRIRPDILLLLGDRFEMLSAAVSAIPLGIVMAHIHGGELTFGATDDAIRHAISKLSHLHFVSTEPYGRRLRQMGEEPNRVFVTGSPIVDVILSEPPLTREELESELGLPISHALLITYHAETLACESPQLQISKLLQALSSFHNELIFTYPNADAGYAGIIDSIRSFVASNPRARLFFNLGRRKYHSLQRHVAAMVGNSSSGILEAPSFRLPAVNIGERQAGRLRTPNVIDVPSKPEEIEEGIRRALSPRFRADISNLRSPFGDGSAANRIVQVLKGVPLDGSFLRKGFYEFSEA